MKNCSNVRKNAKVFSFPARKRWLFRRRCALVLLLFASIWSAVALAQIELADRIQDHMVVQRGMPWEVTGTADSNASFDATFGEQALEVHPVNGIWKVRFDIPLNLSGPAELKIDGGRLVRKIQVGDVWLCSGQSNMAWGLRGVSDKDQITEALRGKTVRVFQVPKPMHISQPHAGRWMDAMSSQAVAFSAVCLAFGASLYDRAHVPIGLIDATLGGTWIESWISPRSFQQASSVRAAIARYESAAAHRKREGLRTETYGIDKPSQLFDLMIAPLASQAIKGAVWYQGEGSGANGNNYDELLSLLIRDWRAHWNNPKLPFVIMQLPGFGTPSTGLDTRSGWATIRDAQRIAVASSPPAALVVSVDLGDGTIHPPVKLPFGKRAADVAYELVYSRGGNHLMPMPTKIEPIGDKVQVEFDSGKACIEKTPALAGSVFVAGEDRHWYKAEVEAGRSSITAHSPEVPHPVAVRYAWSEFPTVGLRTCATAIPVSPFRTDNWQ
jgi:sialate O-acetylesterase